MGLVFMPGSVAAEIDQNVRVIASVIRGTQPFDRDLGVDSAIVDASSLRGRALTQAALIDTLPEQEPRIEVRSVEFTGAAAAAEFVPVIDYAVKTE